MHFLRVSAKHFIFTSCSHRNKDHVWVIRGLSVKLFLHLFFIDFLKSYESINLLLFHWNTLELNRKCKERSPKFTLKSSEEALSLLSILIELPLNRRIMLRLSSPNMCLSLMIGIYRINEPNAFDCVSIF